LGDDSTALPFRPADILRAQRVCWPEALFVRGATWAIFKTLLQPKRWTLPGLSPILRKSTRATTHFRWMLS
jgi:hypothetical protein